MEKATIIRLTLDEAKEWYNSGNEILIKLALEAFSKDELTLNFKNITTFKKACETLGYNYNITMTCVTHIATFSKASAAMFKLNIVRKALNIGQNLKLIKDLKGSEDPYVYYPYNPFITRTSDHYDDQINSGKVEILGKIKSGGKEYYILNGTARDGGSGLGGFNFYNGVGYADTPLGLLGCATKEIAQHFGKYFGMLITEAKYGDLEDFEIIQ